MNFQGLKTIGNADFYIDVAFRRASKTADEAREERMRSGPDAKLNKSKNIELARISAIKNSLNEKLSEIVKSFPHFGNMPIFYDELVKITIDYDLLKKSLAAVDWARRKVHEFYSKYQRNIKAAREIPLINKHRREFYGRIASALKQINENLVFLEDARRIMVEYPVIKTDLHTIAIIGFPNVGKTTLLFKLTGSEAEIKAYAFTTLGINIGNRKEKEEKIQYLDTPGTLNRFDKMNNIEKVAFLAMKYVANEMLYVFDLTESYPLDDQMKLYERVKEFKKPIKVYLSKQDIIDKKIIDAFKKKNKSMKFIDSL